MSTPTTTKDFEHAAKLTHLRLELALAMQTLRASAGLTQAELADRMGVNQPAIAKLERVGEHKIENVLRYLNELDADLLVAVRQGDDVVQVSDDREHLLVAVPREVDDWAAVAGMDLDEFVMHALRDAHAKTQRYDVRGGTLAFNPAAFAEYTPEYGKAA